MRGGGGSDLTPPKIFPRNDLFDDRNGRDVIILDVFSAFRPFPLVFSRFWSIIPLFPASGLITRGGQIRPPPAPNRGVKKKKSQNQA